MFNESDTVSRFELLPELQALLNAGNYKYPQISSPPVQYEQVGKYDTSKAVPDTAIAPYRYICQIEAEASNGWVSKGTGFFVGPKTILTTAHNVWDPFAGKSGEKMPNEKITVTPARNGKDIKPFGVFNPVNVILSTPDFKNTDKSTYKDYAVIQINESIGKTTGYFGLDGAWAEDKTGSQIQPGRYLPAPVETLTINLSGYPGDMDDQQYMSSDKGYKLIDSERIITYFNDTRKGHSGSPVWINRSPDKGGRVVIGIHLDEGPKAKAGGVVYNKAVFINYNVWKFIRDNQGK
jgi:V8-like Glu-specific endopeptidase